MTVDGEPKGGQTSTPLDLLLQYVAQEPARCKSTDNGNGHQWPSMVQLHYLFLNGSHFVACLVWQHSRVLARERSAVQVLGTPFAFCPTYYETTDNPENAITRSASAISNHKNQKSQVYVLVLYDSYDHGHGPSLGHHISGLYLMW